MNTLGTNTTHEKAHANSTGLLELINSFDPATRQGLADDNILLCLYNLYEQLGIERKLLHCTLIAILA